jgi:YjbE family integral membrane protein
MMWRDTMEHLLILVLGVLQIAILDLTLCIDNIGVIALATRNLPSEYAKKAGLFGIAGAIGLRIIFACFMTLILAINNVPIKLIGGLLLIKITWDFIKPYSEEEEVSNIREAHKFWEAVGVIIVADVSMSLDNVLAIAGAANGDIWLIIFGIAFNIPVLFLGSQFVAKLMTKYRIMIYIGGAVLAHTAFNMIFEDNIVSTHMPHLMGIMIPWMMAAATLAYGVYLTRKDKPAME